MRNPFAFILLLFLGLTSCQTKKGDYVCTPCDLECDNLTFFDAGSCPHCGMALVKESELNTEKRLVLNQIELKEGSGAFLIQGGNGNEDNRITVFYHKPKNFDPSSRVLMVIPGAGRNGDSYRDAWVAESEKYGLLILSPMYPDNEYEFEDYHLGGLLTDTNLKSSIEYVENTNIALLDESKFDYEFNSDSKEWIFNDFDRIFEMTVGALDSKQTSYDMFGHSAGGHILHRLALFQKNSKANKILASNPSFYTLPDFETAFPFGCKNTPLAQETLKEAFEKELVVFLGELDNENETGGTFLRSTTADKQGLHRLERGKNFYRESKALAEDLKLEFNWDLVIVPNVGHNHEKMGDAAAMYLYDLGEK